ncbi:TIGR00730 family Rossman fold protein [Thioclava pacifica]|uniref:AMP nucleosidase n=1 Tax=Thioclava pacifica DSM 10166 TaxID=1353537 RepID=A0A074J2Z4_9RHOB|nr:TIGR00730 family Rossman fold protein [Thioclava pacifica]KEO50884.1 hypothetical protein TP2_13430 [Thioclava pacifica DSM 10166]
MATDPLSDLDKPEPAPDIERAIELPWSQPKTDQEDVRAPDLLREIMAHPNYLEADADLGFLNRDDMRGTRLQMDYQKAETLLNEHGIAHSIVVFGGTRIPEPAVAQERLAEITAQAAAHPEDKTLRARVAIAARIVEKSRYYEVAREFGRIVGAKEGHEDNRLVIVTGGGPGMMEAANRGAYEAGAKTIGLNITLPHEQFPNPYITPGLCFRFRYFALRKLHFLMRARALVVFPGGYGTLDELFETLTLIQTRKIRPVPVILVGREYWQRAFDPDFLVAEGVIDPEDRELFWYAESAQEIWEDIGRWYGRLGREIVETEGGGEDYEDFISRCRT